MRPPSTVRAIGGFVPARRAWEWLMMAIAGVALDLLIYAWFHYWIGSEIDGCRAYLDPATPARVGSGATQAIIAVTVSFGVLAASVRRAWLAVAVAVVIAAAYCYALSAGLWPSDGLFVHLGCGPQRPVGWPAWLPL